MNYLTAISSHPYFKGKNIKEIFLSSDNIGISLSVTDGQLTIFLSSKKKKLIKEKFYQFYNYLFLILGGFPELKSIMYNDNELCISELVKKYFTSTNFLRENLSICDFSESTISSKNFETFLESVHFKSLSSFQYILCKEYEHIITDHKIVLMLHVLDAINKNYPKHNTKVKAILCDLKDEVQKYNQKSRKKRDMPGEYFAVVHYIFKPFFKYHKKYNCEILKELNISKNELVSILTDTRNGLSHFLDKKIYLLTDGKEMIIFIQILAFAFRLFLIEDIDVTVNENSIKESLYVIHDWIIDVKHRKNPIYKSRTYLINQGMSAMVEKLNELSKIESN